MKSTSSAEKPQLKSESKEYFTYVESECSNSAAMARYSDVVQAVQTQFHADLEELAELQDEQAKLRAAYLRFQDLEKRKGELKKRAETAAALLAGTDTYEIGRESLGDTLDKAGINTDVNWRKKVPKWCLLAEVVRQFPKIQIVELMRVLRLAFGVEVSRQAVESALVIHASKFRITWKGREKFVSMK
jgi:hypothetical protein